MQRCISNKRYKCAVKSPQVGSMVFVELPPKEQCQSPCVSSHCKTLPTPAYMEIFRNRCINRMSGQNPSTYCTTPCTGVITKCVGQTKYQKCQMGYWSRPMGCGTPVAKTKRYVCCIGTCSKVEIVLTHVVHSSRICSAEQTGPRGGKCIEVNRVPSATSA